MHFSPLPSPRAPSGLGSCLFQGGGSVVDDSLSIVAPIVCVVVFCLLCYSALYVLLVLQSHCWEGERWLLLMSCDYLCSVALPHSAVGWFTVCDCFS